MRVLLTGAAGFVGHYTASYLEQRGHEVVALVRMNTIGDLNRLNDIGFTGDVVWHDLKSVIPDHIIERIGKIDAIVHMGAETHVDRSIINPEEFVLSNVIGTTHLLDYARKIKLQGYFLQFSTDEVFGPAPYGEAFTEESAHCPRNPYAATKSAAEALVIAYSNTYGMHGMIVRSMNIFGERQHREKFIPKVIKSVLLQDVVPIHSNPDLTKAGSRFYTYVQIVADAVHFLLNSAYWNEVRTYHVVGEREVDNLQMAQHIASILGKTLKYEMVNFHESRPGHDLRYAMKDSKLGNMGWDRKFTFDEALVETVRWYQDHPQWLGIAK